MDEYQEIAEYVINEVDFAPLNGRSVLITGGSGLLGSHIVNIMQSARKLFNFKLTVAVQREKDYEHPSLFTEIIYINLANPNDCARLPYADIVISAASYAQPLRFLEQPLMALRSSSLGVMALLERVNPGGRFLYISSSEVYCGCQAEPPLNEEQIGQITPYHPRACYISGKLFGEAMTYLYRNRGISTVAIRPGIIYGPGTKRGDRRSWASFIERAIIQRKIELMDSGKVIRTFCNMRDGMELLFLALLYGKEAVYNVAGHDSLTIAEMAKVIGEYAHVPVIIPDEDHGVAGTPDDLRLDISRIEKEFNKHDYYSLDQGVTEAIDWWRRTHA